MALACSYWVFFFLFDLVYLTYPSDCSKCDDVSFTCGDLVPPLKPISNNSNLKREEWEVDCSSHPPTVKLGAEGHRFRVLKKISKNRAHVEDLHLDALLQKRDCGSLQNLSQPSSSFASFAFKYPLSITILSCIKKPQDCNNSIRDYFGGEYHTYHYHEDCHVRFFYYSEQTPYASPSKERTVPESCSMINMPAKQNKSVDDLFGLLTPEFHLEWKVFEECLSCRDKGGMCATDSGNRVQCQKSKRKKVLLGLAIAATVAAFLGLCFVISYLIYRCMKKADGTYLLSRNISSGPSSKSDLEGGRFYLGILIFSYQELEDATNNFNSSRELGDGGFGTVYYGILRDGREVEITRLYEHNCRRVEQFMNEINILTCLGHPNPVSFYGCTSRRSRELLLVYEYIPNGTVADHLYNETANRSPLAWPIRLSIAIETASALAYLHASDIIHRDVKTNNILLDNNFCVKVADFGLSRLFPNDVSHISTTPQGTPGYVDPEYHQCYQLTNKSDVYSFGVVLIELISSMPAVDLTRHRHEINLANLAVDRIQRCAFDELIDSSLGYPTDVEVTRMTTLVAELAFRCLQLEKDLRPSMDEVLAFLKDIQAGESCSLEKINGKYSLPGRIITSLETDDSVLLKRDIQSSPATVTEP